LSKITFITLTFEKEREQEKECGQKRRGGTQLIEHEPVKKNREKIRAQRQTNCFKWGDEFFLYRGSFEIH